MELKTAAAAARSDPARPSVAEIEAGLRCELAARLRLQEGALNVNTPITRYGIDSLIATEVAHSLEEKTGVRVPMELLLDGLSIRELASGAELRAEPPKSPRGEEHALSMGQQALWQIYRVSPRNAAYNLSAALRFRPALSIPRLRSAIQALVDRHAALRSVFVNSTRGPVQTAPRQTIAHFHAEDASTWDDAALNRRLVDASHAPFDLENGPLLKTFVFSRPPQECVVLLAVHHIVSDLWSLTILLRELVALYIGGRQAELPALPFEYSDFVRRQQDLLTGPEGQRHWKYWQEQLQGPLPQINLPADRPRPTAQSYQGSSQTCVFGAELSEGLKKLSQECGTTLYVTLLALVQVLLCRYTDQEDLIVGSPMLGRNGFEWAGVLGYFVNTVPLRARIRPQDGFRAFVSQVRQTALDALEHQDYPLSAIVERLQPHRDAGRSPLFDVTFVFQNPPRIGEQDVTAFALGLDGATLDFGDFQIESIALDKQAAQFDLTVIMGEVKEGLGVAIRYSTALFDGSRIGRMLRHLQTLASSITANPDLPIGLLPLLIESERMQLLAECRGNASLPHPAESVVQLIEEQVRRYPLAPAVACEGVELTYQELDRRANELAGRLRGLGVKPEVGVAVCMERSLDVIVAILGVLKAGGYYVPLDPGEPQERLETMLQEAKPAALLTQEQLLERFANTGCYKLCIDRETWRAESPAMAPRDAAYGASLAYVIFTSGSTGRPRGVGVEHRQLLNYVCAIQERLDFPERAGFATVSTISADLGNTMVFPSLCTGGTLHVISHDRSLDARAFAEYCARHSIDCLKIVGSHLQILLKSAYPEQILPRRRLVLGGEACSWELIDTLQALAPECAMFNHYGPTEATVGVLTHPLPGGPSDRCSATAPLGRPLANIHACVLDRNLQPVPPGIPGELYLGGACVTRGYLGRPDLTAAKFVPDSLSGEPGARLYKTGDMARLLENGVIEFLGRMDNQVKIRGFRIELEEIEALLSQHPAVRQAAVLAVNGDEGGKRLLAYVAAAAGDEPSARELRRFLKQRAPQHMIPSTFLALDELPVTRNGKVDRKALPELPARNLADDLGFEAARTPLEEALAEMCARTVGVDKVGINDNFFELGGHSLMATQMVSQLQEAFPSETPLLALFFENPTISALAGAILAGQDTQEETERAARIVQTLDQYCSQ